jgi:glycine/D-amino acid oxidase-like deaminating enzyme
MPQNCPTKQPDTVVIGGGLVGMSIAYGLALIGRRVTVLDEGDDAFRAARGNFGLLWVQGKGYGNAAYARWTREAVALWPQLDALLREDTGIDVHLRQPGGLQLCLSDAEMADEASRLAWLREALDGDYPYQLLDPAELKARVPGIGADVVGACFSPMDGHVNPLKLLRALHVACQKRGVTLVGGVQVDSIDPRAGGFEVRAGDRQWCAERLVLAAGLGNRPLGAMLGMTVPVRPNRGQILVTERLRPFLDYPTTYVRQTDEGTVQLGDSLEDAGFDDRTRSDVLATIAARGVQCFPGLADVRMVRAWGALRVLSADGFPIYEAAHDSPGAFVVSCHSGVTLAAAHALRLAPWIGGLVGDAGIQPFNLARFDGMDEVPYAH